MTRARPVATATRTRLHGVNAGGIPAAPIDGDRIAIETHDGIEWLDVGPLLRERDAAVEAAKPSYPPTMSRSAFEALTPRQKMDVATSGKTRLVD